MNREHVRKGYERLVERRAELVAELARLERRRAAVSELLALVDKQEAAAAEALQEFDGGRVGTES